MDKLNLTIPPDLKAIPALAQKITAFYHKHNLEDAHKLNLALEELIANIINHGSPPPPDHLHISLGMSFSGNTLEIQLKDNGALFNPLEAPLPDLKTPISQRPVGGLGIHLAKKNGGQMHYERKNNLNYLRLELTFSRDQLQKVM